MKEFDNTDMENNDNNQEFPEIITNNDHFKHYNQVSSIASAPPFRPPYVLAQTIISSNDIIQTTYVKRIILSRSPIPRSICKSKITTSSTTINTPIPLTNTSDIVDNTINGMVFDRNALTFDSGSPTTNKKKKKKNYPLVAPVLSSLPPSQ